MAHRYIFKSLKKMAHYLNHMMLNEPKSSNCIELFLP